MTRYFLCVPRRELGNFSPGYADYFSSPIEVEPRSSCVASRLLYVFEPGRQCEYPMQRQHLRTYASLTNRQRELVDSGAAGKLLR